jgi:CDP-diacylglycerol--glycerol-3-phosphate 3-phosphatidyltransferase
MLKKNIPNALTILRIVLTPVFVLLFWQDRPNIKIAGVGIFVFCCLLDWLDGFLARRWRVESNFGKLIDPLADKILVLAAILVLYLQGYLMFSIFVLILTREVVITFLREVFRRRKVIIPASIWGKIKTVMQMIGLIVLLLTSLLVSYQIWYKTDVVIIANAYFVLVVAVTFLSAIGYFKSLGLLFQKKKI